MAVWSRIERLGQRQAGRVGYAQLRATGWGRGAIEALIERGHLIRVLPRVYALGHVASTRDGKLWDAVLYAVRRARAVHQRRLARPRRRLEYDFCDWCEAWRVPLPLVNERLHGVLVDAYWPAYGVVVELDGGDNHSSPAQRKRDKANDLLLRS